MNAEDISWVKNFVKRFSQKEKLEFWRAVNKYLLPVISKGGNINEAFTNLANELYETWSKANNIK